jgi:hypothetical protein
LSLLKELVADGNCSIIGVLFEQNLHRETECVLLNARRGKFGVGSFFVVVNIQCIIFVAH